MPTKKPTTGAAAHARNKNRAVRQEALREQLSEQCRVQHIIENLGKIEDLSNELDAVEVSRLKASCDVRLKLLGKYLPDLKAVENTISTDEGSGKLTIKWEK